ncbi:MAG: hypothetical protein ACREMA_18625, partial [Longimicrobiales bacterium]
AQFTALGQFADNSTAPIAVTFQATGGSITASGFYTAGTSLGTYHVVAQAPGGQADTSLVVVTATAPPPPTLESITISPPLVTLQSGSQQQYQVTGTYSDGNTENVTSQTAFMAEGGTMTAGGLYTAGNAAGTFEITANADGHTAVATVNIVPRLLSIAVNPKPATVTSGRSLQFSVIGTFTNGQADVTSQATFTATGGTISAAGLYTAGSTAGIYQVRANALGMSDSAAVTVTAATLTRITLQPFVASVVSGQTQQFSVTGTFSDGSSAPVTAAYTATGGTISASGIYTAGSTPGSNYRVIATESVSGHADTSSVTVTAPAVSLDSVVISPAQVSLQTTRQQQFTSRGYFSNGTNNTVPVAYTATGGT